VAKIFYYLSILRPKSDILAAKPCENHNTCKKLNLCQVINKDYWRFKSFTDRAQWRSQVEHSFCIIWTSFVPIYKILTRRAEQMARESRWSMPRPLTLISRWASPLRTAPTGLILILRQEREYVRKPNASYGVAARSAKDKNGKK
jgi:hypothetical protein